MDRKVPIFSEIVGPKLFFLARMFGWLNLREAEKCFLGLLVSLSKLRGKHEKTDNLSYFAHLTQILSPLVYLKIGRFG